MSFLSRLLSRKKEEVPELPPEFLEADPPDWILDLKGTGLPNCGAFSVRVQLRHGARKGSADVLLLPQDESGQPQSATGDLQGGEIDRLFVLLGFSFPDHIDDILSSEAEGLPVTLSIHRHEPYSLKTGTCNLAGWIESRKSRPPTVDIGLILLEVQKRVLPAQGK